MDISIIHCLVPGPPSAVELKEVTGWNETKHLQMATVRMFLWAHTFQQASLTFKYSPFHSFKLRGVSHKAPSLSPLFTTTKSEGTSFKFNNNLFTFVFLWLFSQARMNKDESSFINEVIANSLSSDIFRYLDKTIFQFKEIHLAIKQNEEDSGRGALCRLSPAGGKAQPRGVPACHRLSPAAPKITRKS